MGERSALACGVAHVKRRKRGGYAHLTPANEDISGVVAYTKRVVMRPKWAFPNS